MTRSLQVLAIAVAAISLVAWTQLPSVRGAALQPACTPSLIDNEEASIQANQSQTLSIATAEQSGLLASATTDVFGLSAVVQYQSQFDLWHLNLAECSVGLDSVGVVFGVGNGSGNGEATVMENSAMTVTESLNLTATGLPTASEESNWVGYVYSYLRACPNTPWSLEYGN